MALKVIAARVNPVVSLADAKLYLRVDHSDEDTLIAALVEAATGMVESMTRRSLIYQTYRLTLDAFPVGNSRLASARVLPNDGYQPGIYSTLGLLSYGPLVLPRSPSATVAAGGAYAYALPRIRYYDTSGALQTLVDGTDFLTDLDSNPPTIHRPAGGSSWPATDPTRAKSVEVDFVAGYGATAASVPALLVQAVQMLTAHYYTNREAVGNFGAEVPFAVSSICRLFYDGSL